MKRLAIAAAALTLLLASAAAYAQLHQIPTYLKHHSGGGGSQNPLPIGIP